MTIFEFPQYYLEKAVEKFNNVKITGSGLFGYIDVKEHGVFFSYQLNPETMNEYSETHYEIIDGQSWNSKSEIDKYYIGILGLWISSYLNKYESIIFLENSMRAIVSYYDEKFWLSGMIISRME